MYSKGENKGSTFLFTMQMKTPEQITNHQNDTRKVCHGESSITGHQDQEHEIVGDNGKKNKLLDLSPKIDF